MEETNDTIEGDVVTYDNSLCGFAVQATVDYKRIPPLFREGLNPTQADTICDYVFNGWFCFHVCSVILNSTEGQKHECACETDQRDPSLRAAAPFPVQSKSTVVAAPVVARKDMSSASTLETSVETVRAPTGMSTTA